MGVQIEKTIFEKRIHKKIFGPNEEADNWRMKRNIEINHLIHFQL